MSSSGSSVLVPLVLSPCTSSTESKYNLSKKSDELLRPLTLQECIICNEHFTVGLGEDKQEDTQGDQHILAHLLLKHNLVIADVSQIASLPDYFNFWKDKFKDKPLEEYCSTLLLDKTPDGKYSKDEKYYLLSDVLPIDHQLRKNLQTERLEKILAYNKLEREDATYERECLFCRTTINGTRCDFLQHLHTKHNFYIAKSDNLVFTGELIEMLAEKLDSFVCIYCEKVFKDRVVLKEHMRKKAHKRINPENKSYDKFFMSNYLEVGRDWQSYLKSVNSRKKKKSASSVQSSRSGERNVAVSRKGSESSDSDNNWSDWEEKDSQVIICLFCKHEENEYSNLLNHMSIAHDYDFESFTRDFDFYEKVKIVNYIRRQIHLVQCIKCNDKLDDLEKLLKHMKDENHLNVNDEKQLWNQPEFFFPTYEDDGFLCCLIDKDEHLDENPMNYISNFPDVSSRDTAENIIQNSIEKMSEQIALSVIED